jgi:hypothetical protein
MAQTMLETPSGQGSVYDGRTLIADVRYWLHMSKNFRTVKSPAGMWRLPGPVNITGEIEVISGERDLLGTFTLQLADQRQWDCVIKAGASGSGKYQASNGLGGLTAKT